MSSFICLSMYVSLLHICKRKRVYRHKLHRVLKYDVHIVDLSPCTRNVLLRFPLVAFFYASEFRVFVSFVYHTYNVQRQTFMLRVKKYAWSERVAIRSQSSFEFIVICPHSIRDSIHIHFRILDIFSCRLYYTCKLAYRQNYAKHRT